jgi:LCP family protein required for cell wall assembly
MAEDQLGPPTPRRTRRQLPHGPHLSPGKRRGLRAAVAAVSFAVLIGSGLTWASYQNFTNSIPRGTAVPALAAGQHDTDGGDQNILLIGNDSREGASPAELKALSTGEDGGSINADTMIVLHVPANGGKASLVSFPRDSWVTIPGYGEGKINAAYPDGYNAAKATGADETVAQSAGIILTIKTISALTGLHIDHYMQVNLLGFYRISNAIGGVSVCLLHAQNADTDSDAFGKGYSGINLPAGVSVIKGTQALAFVRQRHGLPNGDLDRIKRQQYFLASAFHKIESAGVLLNPFKLHNLLNAVGSSLLIDPSLNLLSLAQEFDALTSGNITYNTLPNNGPQTIYPDGVETSIVQVDTAAIPAFIRTLEGKAADPALAKATAAPAASVTVDVLNGTSVVGLAGRNAAQLKALGFHTNNVISTDPTAKTTVEYPPGLQAQAKAVAAAVPGATLVLTSSVSRATLVLGSNGVQVKGLTVPTAPASSPTAVPLAGSTTGRSTAAKATAPPAPPVGLGCIN